MNTVESTAAQPFKRFDIPIKMGVIIGLVGCVLNTANYKFLLPVNYIGYLVFLALVNIGCVFLYGVTGAMQRKAVGGFIDIKGAFQAIFVAILISTLMIAIWGFIYSKYIDPQFADKVKAGAIGLMERMKVPQEKLDETAARFDKGNKEKLSFANMGYDYATNLILRSLFGFICAAIVRRNPPETMR